MYQKFHTARMRQMLCNLLVWMQKLIQIAITDTKTKLMETCNDLTMNQSDNMMKYKDANLLNGQYSC